MSCEPWVPDGGRALNLGPVWAGVEEEEARKGQSIEDGGQTCSPKQPCPPSTPMHIDTHTPLHIRGRGAVQTPQAEGLEG